MRQAEPDLSFPFPKMGDKPYTLAIGKIIMEIQGLFNGVVVSVMTFVCGIAMAYLLRKKFLRPTEKKIPTTR